MNNAHYSYTDIVNNNLVCCICQNPFIDPVVTSKCAHTFCRECISSALLVNSQCPVDRSPLTIDQLHPAAAIVRNLVDELLVVCPNASLGCDVTPQRIHLGSHLSSDCQFVHVECSQPQCENVVLRKDLGKHSDGCDHRLVECEACGRDVKFSGMESHEDVCPAKEITCVHCATTLPRSSLTSHYATCQYIPITCIHTVNGCPWHGPRHTLESNHLPTCAYEAIKGFFAIHEDRTKSLLQENADLKRTVSDLENKVVSQQRDLECAKVRLGPWFKLPTQQGAGHTSSGSMDSADASGGVGAAPQRIEMRRRLSVPLNSAIFAVEDSNSRRNRAPSLSQTNSPPESNSQQTGDGPSLDVSFDDTFSTFSSPNPNSTPTNPLYLRTYSNNPVAPLNLSSSLEGTLTSLRQSIVSLGGSLDSLERKQDIMLTTETLRMHEDVASVRAIVHGLRMQVHNIMMDRNIYFNNRLSTSNSPTSSIFPTPTLGHPPSLTSLVGMAATHQQQSFNNGGTSYSTISRLPHMPHLPDNNSDAQSDIAGESSEPDTGVSSAVRYLNSNLPAAYYGYSSSPNFITTTSVRRGPEGKL
ncbi:hypothetical protein FRB95_007944 [Tulasnella sp. JGI-2019a]|nr:hypothetical protein FRB93_008550 [Tulasnella sp. JGI-2019a]KAG9027261.1 hypothetical protein FRB95_007944 [Tulasnella sp. JGI-2019a]